MKGHLASLSMPSPNSSYGPESTIIPRKGHTPGPAAEVSTPRAKAQSSGDPHPFTSGACYAQGGPAHSDGLFARKTGNAPVAGLYSNDFFSCIFQKYPPAPVSGSESGRSSGSGTCVASGQSTCSPWISGSSAPWSLCRGRPGGPVVGGSHSGSVSGSVTWIHQMWSHCHFSCEGDHQAGDSPSRPSQDQEQLSPRRGHTTSPGNIPVPAAAPCTQAAHTFS